MPLHLTPKECNALKGIAITGIILHNFCHWLPGITHENEFHFDIEYVSGIQHALAQPDSQLLLHLLSYFGHYGVAIFIFLSGYGLVLKYERQARTSGDDATFYTFIKKHYLKLLKLLVPGLTVITLWNVHDYFKYGDSLPQLNHVIAQLLMYINFYPYPGDAINPGPYWFFGLMLQLYIIYKTVIHRKHWIIPVISIIACFMPQFLFSPDSPQTEWMHYNFIGNMLPFGLGVLYARHIHQARDHSDPDGSPDPRRLSKWTYGLCLVVSMILLYVTGLNFYSWMLTPLFAITSLLCLIKLLPDVINSGLKYLGLISSALFVFHPIARRLFVYRAQQGDLAFGLTMYIIVSVAGALLLYALLNYQTLYHRIKKRKS